MADLLGDHEELDSNFAPTPLSADNGVATGPPSNAELTAMSEMVARMRQAEAAGVHPTEVDISTPH
eukprot:8954207-Karenia_brevis.AAC.1